MGNEMTSDPFQERIIVFISSFFIAAFTSFVAWRLGFYQLPNDGQVDSSEKITWIQVFGAFSTFFSVQFLIVPSIYMAWVWLKQGIFTIDVKAHPGVVVESWLNFIGIILTVVALALYSLWQDKGVMRAVWGKATNQSRHQQDLYNYFIGAVSWWIVYPLISSIGQIIAISVSIFYQGPQIDQVAVNNLREISSHPEVFWSLALAIIFIVPVIEELLFRGFMQKCLNGILGARISVIITSLIFSALHFSVTQGMNNIELLISLFVLSCFLGFLRERQNSLWSSIGLHSTFNAMSVLILLHQNLHS